MPMSPTASDGNMENCVKRELAARLFVVALPVACLHFETSLAFVVAHVKPLVHLLIRCGIPNPTAVQQSFRQSTDM
jgi:hypothetical protein